MDSFTLSQLKEIHELLGLPSQISHARGRLEGLIEAAVVDEDEECEHNLKQEMVFAHRSTDEDGELMNCCTKCDHQERTNASDWIE